MQVSRLFAFFELDPHSRVFPESATDRKIYFSFRTPSSSYHFGLRVLQRLCELELLMVLSREVNSCGGFEKQPLRVRRLFE